MKKIYLATYKTTDGICSTAVVRTRSKENIQSLLERFAKSGVGIIGTPQRIDDLSEGVLYDSHADSDCGDCAQEGAYHPFPNAGIRN